MSQNAAQVRMFLCYMNPIQSILLLYINTTSKCACEIYLEEFGMFSKIHMKFSIFPCELAWSLVLGCLNTGTNGEGKSTGKLSYSKLCDNRITRQMATTVVCVCYYNKLQEYVGRVLQ